MVSTLQEAIQLNAQLQTLLPEVIHPQEVSSKAKIPYKVLMLRELLIHRMAELSDEARILLSAKKVLPSLILARAAFETTAALFTLRKKIKSVLDSEKLGQIDDEVVKLVLGSRSGIGTVEAFNVLTFIDHLNETFEGLRKTYEDLCDFTHPNWSGCYGVYGQLDRQTKSVTFKKNSGKALEFPYSLGITSLVMALEIFIDHYHELSEILPKFTEVCDEADGVKS